MTLDPYRDWLLISEPRRPLSHYQLLGLQPSEQDAEHIQAAYARSMSVVRRYQVGAHMDVALRVINELSDAFATLTHPQQRQAYDRSLTLRVEPPQASTAEPLPAPPTPKSDKTTEPASLPVRDAERLDSESQATTPAPKVAEAAAESKPNSRQTAGIASSVVTAATLAALLVWVLEDDSPPVVPIEQTRARKVVTSPVPANQQPQAKPAPIAVGTIERCLIDPPADGSSANFSAIVRDVGEGGITVVAKEGDTRGVRVLFDEAPRELFEQLQYEPGARVQVMGTVVSDSSLDPPWRVQGKFMVRLEAPSSPVNALVIARARRARTPAVATTQASAAPPEAPTPTLSPWEQKLSESQDAWNKLHERQPGERLVLSAAFVSYTSREPLPPELFLRLRFSTIRIRGPFLSPGEVFLQQLKGGESLVLEVVVANPTRNAREVELMSVARAGAAPAERVVCRTESTVPLVRSIDVNQTGTIHGLAWSPVDGNKLVVVAQPATLWDATTGARLSTLHSNQCLRATWTSDGAQIALVVNGQIVICDPAGKPLASLPTRADRGPLVASHPQQPLLVLAAETAANAQTTVGLMVGSNLTTQALRDLTGTSQVAWNSGGTRLALAARDTRGFSGIRISKLKPSQRLDMGKNIPFGEVVDDLQWVPQSDLLAVYANQKLTIGDPLDASRPPLQIPRIHDARNYAFSSDGHLVSAVVSGGKLQVWRMNAVNAAQWEDDVDQFSGVAWSPARPHLAAIDSSHAICLWNASGLRLTRLLTGAGNVAGLAFSPDGNRLAVYGANRVEIYDVSQVEK